MSKNGGARPAKAKQQRCLSAWAGRSGLGSVWATSEPWNKAWCPGKKSTHLNYRSPALKGTTRLSRCHQIQGGSGPFTIIYLGRLPGRRLIASIFISWGDKHKSNQAGDFTVPRYKIFPAWVIKPLRAFVCWVVLDIMGKVWEGDGLSYNKIMYFSWVDETSWQALRLQPLLLGMLGGMFSSAWGHRRLSVHTVEKRRRRLQNRTKCKEQQGLSGCPSGASQPTEWTPDVLFPHSDIILPPTSLKGSSWAVMRPGPCSTSLP